MASHYNLGFIETSAKHRLNVDEAFTELVKEIRTYYKVTSIPYIILTLANNVDLSLTFSLSLHRKNNLELSEDVKRSKVKSKNINVQDVFQVLVDV